MTSPFIKLRVLPKIEFIEMDDDNIGTYFSSGDYIVIDKNLDIESAIRTIIHELGHLIHHRIFDYEEFNFPEENKPEYAYTNSAEDFACCFEQLVYYREINSRTKMMINILENAI